MVEFENPRLAAGPLAEFGAVFGRLISAASSPGRESGKYPAGMMGQAFHRQRGKTQRGAGAVRKANRWMTVPGDFHQPGFALRFFLEIVLVAVVEEKRTRPEEGKEVKVAANATAIVIAFDQDQVRSERSHAGEPGEGFVGGSSAIDNISGENQGFRREIADEFLESCLDGLHAPERPEAASSPAADFVTKVNVGNGEPTLIHTWNRPSRPSRKTSGATSARPEAGSARGGTSVDFSAGSIILAC